VFVEGDSYVSAGSAGLLRDVREYFQIEPRFTWGTRHMSPTTDLIRLPFTQAVRRALDGARDPNLVNDLLFLEAWELKPSANLGLTLRAGQIRRANPGLTAEINAELQALSGIPVKPRKPVLQLD
jgi:hypothetical protein